MPRKVTRLARIAWYVASRSAASTRHGAHQDAQKFTTTTSPAYPVRSTVPGPASSGPDSAGAGLRWDTGNDWTRALSAGVPVLHPASASSPARASSRTARGRTSGALSLLGAGAGGDQV